MSSPPIVTGFSGKQHLKSLVIYTGGTIGMKRTGSGLTPVSGYLRDVLSDISELKHSTVPDFDVLEWETLYDSADMTPALWIKLAQQIEHYYYSYDGFVILHGTDTMAYTASALSFMLENLGKTVVLTGSMIPLEAPVSDAKRNLIISLMVSGMGIPEVCIFFSSTLLRGNRSKKVDPWDNDAFLSPNMAPLARMGVAVDLNQQLILPAPRRSFHARTRLFTNISAMVMIPGMDDTCIRACVDAPNSKMCIMGGTKAFLSRDILYPSLITPLRPCPCVYTDATRKSCVAAVLPPTLPSPLPSGITSPAPIGVPRELEEQTLKRPSFPPSSQLTSSKSPDMGERLEAEEARPPALVLALYGAGNAPIMRKDFLETIRYCVEEKHAIVVICSQCLKGYVDMTQYATGVLLSKMGVIDARDMTLEACVTKLSYLIARGLNFTELKHAMETNLRGELTEAKSRAYASINDDLAAKL